MKLSPTALEKVGLVSRADRVYLCLFHDRKTRLSITHEWLNETASNPRRRFCMGASLKIFPDC
jgi:hypothetical protein